MHRTVPVLVEQRFLKSGDGRDFDLGPRLIELGFAAYSRLDIVRIARPWLEDLSRETRDTVHLAERDGWEVTYLDKLPGAPGGDQLSGGGLKPIISTGVGKALLLDADEQTLHQFYDRNHALLSPSPSSWSRLASFQKFHRHARLSQISQLHHVPIRKPHAPTAFGLRQRVRSISAMQPVGRLG